MIKKVITNDYHFVKKPLFSEERGEHGPVDMFVGYTDVAVPDIPKGGHKDFLEVVMKVAQDDGFDPEAIENIWYEDEPNRIFDKYAAAAKEKFKRVEIIPNYDGAKDSIVVWIEKEE